MQVLSIKNQNDRVSKRIESDLEGLDVLIDVVDPLESGDLHNEILEIFSRRHILKPSSLSKKEFIRNFTDSANQALINRGIDPIVSDIYVENVIGELIEYKEKGIYDFFQPQKAQDPSKFLSYLGQKGVITRNEIEETQKLLILVKTDISRLKSRCLLVTLQNTPEEEQSIKVVRTADVARGSAKFWDLKGEHEAEFTCIARDIGLILADLLGALVGGVIGAAIFSIAFIITWWLLENE